MSQSSTTLFFKKHSRFMFGKPKKDAEFISDALFFPWIISSSCKGAPFVWVLYPDYVGYLSIDDVFLLNCLTIARPFSKRPSLPIKSSLYPWLKPENLSDAQRERVIDVILASIRQNENDCWFYSCNIFIWSILATIDELQIPWDTLDIQLFIGQVKILFGTQGGDYWRPQSFMNGDYDENAIVKLVEIYFGVENIPLLQYDVLDTDEYLDKQKKLISDHLILLCSHTLKDNAFNKETHNGAVININSNKMKREGNHGHALVMFAPILIPSKKNNDDEENDEENDAKDNNKTENADTNKDDVKESTESTLIIPAPVKRNPNYHYLVKDSGGGLDYYYVKDNSNLGEYLKKSVYTIPWRLITCNKTCIDHFLKFFAQVWVPQETDVTNATKKNKWREQAKYRHGNPFHLQYRGKLMEGLPIYEHDKQSNG